jgi:hypothetical protein
MICACMCTHVREVGGKILIHIPAECNLITSINVPSADGTYTYRILQENLKRKDRLQDLVEREHNLNPMTVQACL